jgi:hypothetical protein
MPLRERRTRGFERPLLPLIRPSGTFCRRRGGRRLIVFAFSRFFQREKVPKGPAIEGDC